MKIVIEIEDQEMDPGDTMEALLNECFLNHRARIEADGMVVIGTIVEVTA
jgi:hypothetical protein